MNLHFKYLGNGVGTIHAFPFVYAGVQEWPPYQLSAKGEISKVISDHSHFGLVAVTADQTQSYAHSFLLSQGFRRVVRLMSSHKSAAEQLTLWVRENRAAKHINGMVDEDDLMSNCSVGYCAIAKDKGPTHTGYDRNLFLETTKPTDMTHVKKIRGLNLWYKLDPKNLAPQPAAQVAPAAPAPVPANV